MFCLSNCVPMQSALRPDVSLATSPRIASYVGTQLVVRRDVVLGR